MIHWRSKSRSTTNEYSSIRMCGDRMGLQEIVEKDVCPIVSKILCSKKGVIIICDRLLMSPVTFIEL